MSLLSLIDPKHRLRILAAKARGPVDMDPNATYDEPITEAEAEARVRADYEKAKGRVVLCTYVVGYTDSDSIEVDLDTPLPCYVEPTSEGDLTHAHTERDGGWLDPYWNVTPLEERPELDGLTSFWTYGPSYRYYKSQPATA